MTKKLFNNGKRRGQALNAQPGVLFHKIRVLLKKIRPNELKRGSI